MSTDDKVFLGFLAFWLVLLLSLALREWWRNR